MMNKSKKDFEFQIPVTKLSVGNESSKSIHQGNLIVIGNGYDLGNVFPDEVKFASKLENVFYQDVDILPLIKAMPALQPFHEELLNIANQHVEKYLFKTDSSFILQMAENE